MTLVLDASIAVAAARPLEPGHRAAQRLIEDVLAQPGLLIAPTIFAVETAGALARVGRSAPEVLAYVGALIDAAEEIVELDRHTSIAIAELAARERLRGADAVYVWTADRHAAPLFTLDREMYRRGRAVCEVVVPS